MPPWLIVLGPSIVVPAVYWAAVSGLVGSLAAAQTAVIGLLGTGLALSAARRRDLSVIAALGVLALCATGRIEPTTAAVLATGVLVGWRAAAQPNGGALLLAAASLYAYVGLALMLLLSDAWPLGHRNYHAAIIATTWACQIGWLRAGAHSSRRARTAGIANAIGLGTGVLLLIVVLERGQSVLAAFAVLSLLCLSFLRPRLRIVVAVAGFVALAALLLVEPLASALGAILEGMGEWKPLGPRARIWQVALAGWASAPVVGLGEWGMHRALLADDFARVVYWGELDWGSETGNAHNAILQVLVQSGLIGLAGTVVVLGVAIRVAVRSRDAQAQAALWGLAVLGCVGMVSIAPFTESGLFTGACLLGFASTRGAPWPGWLARVDSPGSTASRYLAMGVAALVFGAAVVRPIAHERMLHAEPSPSELRLSWWIWSDASYATVVNHLNEALFVEGRSGDLYDMQLELLRSFGPRRLSLTNAAKTALQAGLVRNGAHHCVEHLRWDPLLYFDECAVILRQIARVEGGEATLGTVAGILPALQQRALRVLTSSEVPDLPMIDDLLGRPETLSLAELAYLVSAARVLERSDPDRALTALVVVRDRVDDRYHLPARIEAIEALGSAR